MNERRRLSSFIIKKSQNYENQQEIEKLSDDGIGIVDIHQKQKYEIELKPHLTYMLNGTSVIELLCD